MDAQKKRGGKEKKKEERENESRRKKKKKKEGNANGLRTILEVDGSNSLRRPPPVTQAARVHVEGTDCTWRDNVSERKPVCLCLLSAHSASRH